MANTICFTWSAVARAASASRSCHDGNWWTTFNMLGVESVLLIETDNSNADVVASV